jgi:hypothetical protein
LHIVGYIHYLVFLFIATGGLLLRFDAKLYDMAEMVKERKAARFLGWLNISLGAAVYVANWITVRWIW